MPGWYTDAILKRFCVALQWLATLTDMQCWAWPKLSRSSSQMPCLLHIMNSSVTIACRAHTSVHIPAVHIPAVHIPAVHIHAVHIPTFSRQQFVCRQTVGNSPSTESRLTEYVIDCWTNRPIRELATIIDYVCAHAHACIEVKPRPFNCGSAMSARHRCACSYSVVVVRKMSFR